MRDCQKHQYTQYYVCLLFHEIVLTQVTQVPFFGLNALLPATSTHPFGNSQILSRSVSTPLQRELLGMDQTNDTEPAPACCKDHGAPWLPHRPSRRTGSPRQTGAPRSAEEKKPVGSRVCQGWKQRVCRVSSLHLNLRGLTNTSEAWENGTISKLGCLASAKPLGHRLG